MVIDEVVEDGDTIDVFLPRVHTGIRIEVENVTQGWYLWETFDRFRPVAASVLYRTMAVDGVPLPVLDPVGAEVTRLHVNGRPLDLTNPKKRVLVDDAGERLVKPSKITDGTDFRFLDVG